MLSILFDAIFPKYCIFCKKKENYICTKCKKIFKRRLPECYICRRLSQDFETHHKCKRKSSLERVYVAWEYDKKSSQILKRYKYTGVYDIGDSLSDFLIDNISSRFYKYLEGTILVPIPSSLPNYNERGFKQMEILVKRISQRLNIPFSKSFVSVVNSYGHQSLRSKEKRLEYIHDLRFLVRDVDLTKYKSITLVDDVITTGSTLESISIAIKRKYDIPIQAICLFRGKPYYF